MNPKTKSTKYEICTKADRKGDVFGLSLISRNLNKNIRDILIFDTAYLFQYDITLAQMNYLDQIQKIWDNKHKVTVEDINKIGVNE